MLKLNDLFTVLAALIKLILLRLAVRAMPAAVFIAGATLSCSEGEGFKLLEEEGAFPALKGKANDDALTLTGVSAQSVIAGEDFNVDMDNALTGDDVGMTYQCTYKRAGLTADCSTLPGRVDATFDPSSGKLHWRPGDDEIGSYEFTFTGKKKSNTDSRTATIEVIADLRPKLPKVANQIVERNSRLLIDFADSGQTASVTYQCFFDTTQDNQVAETSTCQSLPGEPMIKFDTGAGLLAWLPGMDAKESYEIRVIARNEHGLSERLFAVTVIEPRGEVLRLTTAFDKYLNSSTLIFIDFDNEVTGDDVGVTYTCRFDRMINGVSVPGGGCNSLRGMTNGSFDARKGVFTWLPEMDHDDIKVTVRGEKGGAFDEESFLVVFGGSAFGEIGNSALSFNPPSHDFSNILVGNSSDVKQVYVTNISSVDIFVEAPRIGNENFSIAFSTCPLVPQKLGPSGTCIVGVKFNPNVPAGLGTVVTVDFGSSMTDSSRYQSAFALSGVGAGSLRFDGLDEIVDVTHNSLTLNWTANSDAVTFIVFRVNGSALEFIETIMNIGGGFNTRSYTGLSPGTTYTYRVRATDVFGVHDGNTKDITVATRPNQPPVLTRPGSPAVYAGYPIATIDFNDAVTGSDVDQDGDAIIYSMSLRSAELMGR
jgi:hypothetical protein